MLLRVPIAAWFVFLVGSAEGSRRFRENRCRLGGMVVCADLFLVLDSESHKLINDILLYVF